MLFNSYIFIFCFLPVAMGGFFVWRSLLGHWASLVWLTIASLFFYGWWDPRYLWLIGASILFNFIVGRVLTAMRPPDARRKAVLTFGVSVNLFAIAYFKYANFLIENFDQLLRSPIDLPHVVLPLGISFFTFTQIAFLADSYRRLADEPNFLKYTLFVTYFPHLIAGPIIHHKDVMRQMSDSRISVWNSQRLAVGLTIFIIGLCKKVLIADFLAPYPDTVFYIAEKSGHPSFIAGWVAAICYALQIYFDFSGYSDMAIGLSRLFGIQLPINFNSPYKSGSIIEFWRRWHISLSRFLRDYLYFSLGGNRQGKFRRHVNLILTMLLGGLWHGAGWTFLIWGGLHGFYLVCNHVWRGWRRSVRLPIGGLERLAGWGITFTGVLLAWVFFRATSLAAAQDMLNGMINWNGLLDFIRIVVGRQAHRPMYDLPDMYVCALCAVALFIALVLPNTSQIMSRFRPGVSLYDAPMRSAFQWRLSPLYACAAAMMLFVSLALLGRPADFIYFNF